MLDPYGWFVMAKTVDVQCKTWICSAKHVHVHPDGRSARAARRGPCRRKNNSGVLTRSLCRGQTGVRHMTDPVRRGLLPSCDGAPTAAAWGAVTARQEAAPDRGRRLTNTSQYNNYYSSTTDPSVADPVCPDGLPEGPFDKLRPQLLWSELTIVRGSVNQRRIL